MEYGVFDPSQYVCEDQINERVGIYPSTVMSIYERNRIDILISGHQEDK